VGQSGHALKRLVAFLPQFECHWAYVVAGKAVGRVILPEHDQTRGVAIGKRTEKHRVGDVEDSGSAADAEGQRGSGKESKPRRLAKHAQRITKVLPDAIQQREPALLTIGFAQLRHAPQPEHGLAPGLFWSQTSLKIFLGQHGGVGLQFLREVAVQAAHSRPRP